METLHGGHGPVWHFAAQEWEQEGRALEQGELQVGMGSVQRTRAGKVYSDDVDNMEERDAGATRCLPHAQWVIRDGDLGQGSAIGDGGWQAFLHLWMPQSKGL